MEIVLSAQSAACLAKVPDLDTWLVGPTMVKSGRKAIEKPAASLKGLIVSLVFFLAG